ncbi:MAG: hypothetical protein CR977_00820 [Gammaproteobacteria bacterium]|nr:MAG: hypothetical protein CR977_00820 [Gammaproteobacteria bacterium]
MKKLAIANNWEKLTIVDDDGKKYAATEIKSVVVNGKLLFVKDIVTQTNETNDHGHNIVVKNKLPVVIVKTEIGDEEFILNEKFFNKHDVYLPDKPYPVYS